MKFIEPQVEWWPQTTLAQHIARVGRICYKAKGKQPEVQRRSDKRKMDPVGRKQNRDV